MSLFVLTLAAAPPAAGLLQLDVSDADGIGWGPSLDQLPPRSAADTGPPLTYDVYSDPRLGGGGSILLLPEEEA